jgi:hypothetical protein
MTIIATKEAHGSVYTLKVWNGNHVVERQAINPKTGKAWQRLWTLAFFNGDRAGLKALAAFNRAVKTGMKSNDDVWKGVTI